MITFTETNLRQVIPNNKDIAGWVPVLQKECDAAEITVSMKRAAHFISQLAHESLELTKMEEGLVYSKPDRLVAVFSTRFPGPTMEARLAAAAPYVRNPKGLAIKVYSNRLGNGDETTTDGWDFRGSGLIQLTGKNNFTQFSQDTYGDDRIVKNPDLVRTDKSVGLASAIWFWKKNNLNQIAESGDVKSVTRVINGPKLEGLDMRSKYLSRCITAFGS